MAARESAGIQARGLLALLLAASTVACDSRSRTNPLDPDNPDTGGVPANLEALAGDDKVDLRWSDLGLRGIRGFRLWRWVAGGASTQLGEGVLPIEIMSYRDSSVVNGVTYTYRLDFLVEQKVVVEIKAIAQLLSIHDAQLLTYLKLGEYPVGLLLNFNVPVLKEGIRRKVFRLQE